MERFTPTTKTQLKNAVTQWCRKDREGLGNISDWDTSNITDMKELFRNWSSFNDDISGWNVSKVTDMYYMFYNAESFNQPIGKWDVSNVSTMYGMFYSAHAFNQPIGNWNVSKVTDMDSMFYWAKAFNQPIGNWNVSKVTNMERMFQSAHVFNQPIGNWDVSKVTSMRLMFNNSGYTHPKPGEAPPKPPPCMSQAEYEKCIAKGDTKPIDVISQEELEIKDAVKLPGQPNTCYDRRELKKWFKNNKTNPLSREPVTQDWIDKNMGDQDCKPQTEGGKGKGKRKTKKRKSKKSTKTKKQTKKKAPKRKKRT